MRYGTDPIDKFSALDKEFVELPIRASTKCSAAKLQNHHEQVSAVFTLDAFDTVHVMHSYSLIVMT